MVRSTSTFGVTWALFGKMPFLGTIKLLTRVPQVATKETVVNSLIASPNPVFINHSHTEKQEDNEMAVCVQARRRLYGAVLDPD